MNAEMSGAPPIHLHASERLEDLAEHLAQTMRARPGDPLGAERIVVPRPLLGQWLRLQLAERLGIAAHLRIELPAEFAWSAMRERLPDLPGQAVFEPAYLRWRIFERLGDWPGDDEIGRYLAGGDARKRFELADRLAIAYDRCLVFRPDAIRRWQVGDGDAWHARLWTDLVADQAPALHWVDAIDSYAAQPGAAEGQCLPRVSIFGVATLSPSLRDFLAIAAHWFDIHLFLLSPSREFWVHPPPRNTSGHYDESNELLAAWGRPARDMQALLSGFCLGHNSNQPRCDEESTCLGALQSDLLGSSRPKAKPSAPDDSIEIHVCHSATREVEVLHDRLLGVFDRHDDIEPADVLVLTPDVDTYAPIINAVFGAADRMHVAVGRDRFQEGAAMTAFLDLLALPGSRYTANAMVAPLRAESVRACFGIEEADLEDIRDWLRRAGVRWGRDEGHRAALEVPTSPNHTWRHGLRRLLLGYAIEGSDVLLNDITPCALDRWGRAGASDYALMGRFHRYSELAFALDDWHDAEHTPQQWAERLRREILAPFFAAERRFHAEIGREVGAVARLIDAFADECEMAGAAAPVSFIVLRDALSEHAARSIRGVPRLADAVTVAGLATGQVLPAKVVCVVGVNDGVFPRRPPPTPFEFVAKLFPPGAHAVGDRDVRDEDRFAFLEAVLAARRFLLLTYTGRDLKEDKPIPASVVVSELTAHLERHFPRTGGEWETHHPLQPFSPRYFRAQEPRLFSYSKPMATAANALGTSEAAPQRFAGRIEPAAEAAGAEVDIEELIRFAANPTKHFLRHALRLNLLVREDEIDDDEPFELDSLQQWNLKADLQAFDETDDATHALAVASALLPPGNLAKVQHRESSREVAKLKSALTPYTEHTASAEIDVDVDGTRIVGKVERFHAAKQELVWHRIGKVRCKDQIAVWLRLLALTTAQGKPFNAWLLGSKEPTKPLTMQGPDPERARAILGQWLELWHDGKRRVLPFFPETSWQLVEDKSLESAWSAMAWSEGNEEHHRLVYPDGPQVEDFDEIARRLLGPLQVALS